MKCDLMRAPYGDDMMVVDVARVSLAKTAAMFSDARNVGLIQYLAKNQHWSPFAHCCMSFRCEAPLYVARQLWKHQVGLVHDLVEVMPCPMGWNESSRRYITIEPQLDLPDVWRSAPDGSIKQGSGAPLEDQYHIDEEVTAFYETALETYRDLLRRGVAPEQARIILPQSLVVHWIWTGSLFAWARLCKQRLDSHAQSETREFARMVVQHMRDHFPESTKALMEETQ
jgi:thymidylate synthase (FAD)